MPRIAALADIHGNLPALDAIIADLARFAPQTVIVAGDLINFGPFSSQVLERVFNLGWQVMRGNHEFYLLDYNTPRAPDHWRGYTTPRWLNETIVPELRHRVAALPDTLLLTFSDASPIRVYHGFPGNHWDGMYPSTPDHELLRQFTHTTEETVILGHVHLQQERRIHNQRQVWHLINPGSAGLPLDGIPASAPYALLDSDKHNWSVTFRRVSYDPAPLYAALDAPDYREAHGAYARLYAEEFRSAEMRIYPFHRWHSARYPHQPVTEALVDEFLALESEMTLWTPEEFRI